MSKNKKPNTIVTKHKANFNTLKKAFASGDVAIMDCIEKSTNEHVAVICAVGKEGEEFVFTPFARFFNGNPYDMLIPPTDPNYNQQSV